MNDPRSDEWKFPDGDEDQAKKAAMESVDDMAKRTSEALGAEFDRLAVCHCGDLCKGHGYHSGHAPSWNECPETKLISDAKFAIDRLLAALAAERANTDTANAAAVNAYAKVRELEALLDTAKSALAAERVKFAALLDGAKAAVLAERAKFAAFVGPDGEPRKVLGTLPVTTDGFLAGSAALLHYINNDGRVSKVSVLPSVVSDCYSTEAAAKQAAEDAAGKIST